MDSTIFPIAVVVFSILAIIVFAVNAVNFNIIRNGPVPTTQSSTISPSQANILFWVNIIWLLVALAIGIWAVIILFTGRRQTTVAANYISAPAPTYTTNTQSPSPIETNYYVHPGVPLCNV